MPQTDAAVATLSVPPEPTKIVFFGLGAVGSNLLICLAELAGAALLVNAALPAFNCPIIELGIHLGAHTVDLASEMYNEQTDRTLTFAQYDHDEALRRRGVAALINQGISPGVTDFLIGRCLHELLAAGRNELEIESVDLYLLEDIEADSVVFSWSPLTALDELAARPRSLIDGRFQVVEPFSMARYYAFPNEPRATRQYPLYQEELLSLHRAFPEIPTLGVYTGGSEVELVKALFQLNLLSKQTLPDQPELTVEAMVRAILPGMQRPRRIEHAAYSHSILSECADPHPLPMQRARRGRPELGRSATTASSILRRWPSWHVGAAALPCHTFNAADYR